MPEWTPRQQQAILARNRDILVSAAAGSGKTAVLVERVMSLLKEGKDLESMLVMTFTHAAADEMKDRLTQRLSQEAGDDPHLLKQFAALGRADISTLHSFCGRLLRQNFQAADTDPLSRQLDEAQADELFDQALEEAMDQFYEDPSPGDQALMDRFEDEEIKQMVLGLYKFIMAMDQPYEWLEKALSGYGEGSLYEHPWYPLMLGEADLLLSGALELAQMAEAVCGLPQGPARYLEATRDDQALIAQYRTQLRADAPFTWSKPKYTTLPSRPVPPEEDPALAARVRDDLRKRMKDLISSALELLPQDEAQAQRWMAGLRDTWPQLEALRGILLKTSESYQNTKAARALWDFSDLEHLALRALKDPLVQSRAAGRYKALFVDEYQDISRTQEAIIMALRGEGCDLFMVGDVKQSIYRFRLADPGLFLHKHRRFSAAEDAPRRLITLKENFRSDPNILKAVNLVFEHAMRENATEITYDEEARLSSLSTLDNDAPVELHLLNKPGDDLENGEDQELLDAVDQLFEAPEEGEDGGEGQEGRDPVREKAFVYEARLIAQRVQELVQKEGVRYRDIAILLRSAVNRASVLAEILNARGIPTYSDADGDFYTQSDVRDVMNILQALDNPLQDLPLLGALASPAFGFTHNDLADLAQFAQACSLPLHQAFLTGEPAEPLLAWARERMSRWRDMANSMTLERFLPQFLRESGLYASAGGKEEGALRRANLRILEARTGPAPDPQNLHDFVERYKRALEQNRKDRSASLGMQENVVRIMTLHKSKGLQFPVVILPNLASNFSARPARLPLFLDAGTGLALKQIDPQLRTINDGFGVMALKTKKKREELSEEARLLYVGMTRAKHRLILVGSPGAARDRQPLPPGDYAAASARSMLDWVAAPLMEALSLGADTLYTAPGGSRWQVAFHGEHSLPAPAEKAEEQPLALEEEALPWEGSPFEPLNIAEKPPQQKSSVTGLISRAREMMEEETPEVKRRALPKPRELRPLRPPQQEGLTAAQKGAAAHKALCALDPGEYVGLSEEAQRLALAPALDTLVDRGVLTLEEREALDLSLLTGFYGSALARRLVDGEHRRMEWSFTLAANDHVLLQGVLDACFMEDGAWVLVDYKTDYGSQEELLERYTPQMRWYMRALRDITGQPVKEAWLYLLRRGEMVQVTEAETIALTQADLDALRER